MRKIKNYLGVARKNVSKYMYLTQTASIAYPDIEFLSAEELLAIFLEHEEPEKERYEILEEEIEYLGKELKKTGVSKFLLSEEYKSKHPGGYNFTQCCFHLNAYMKANKALMHMEHKSGDKLFIDFAGKKLSIVDKRTGVIDKEVMELTKNLP